MQLMAHAIMILVYQIQYDIIIKILQETIKAYLKCALFCKSSEGRQIVFFSHKVNRSAN